MNKIYWVESIDRYFKKIRISPYFKSEESALKWREENDEHLYYGVPEYEIKSADIFD